MVRRINTRYPYTLLILVFFVLIACFTYLGMSQWPSTQHSRRAEDERMNSPFKESPPLARSHLIAKMSAPIVAEPAEIATVTYTVRRGDNLISIFKRNGVKQPLVEAPKVFSALRRLGRRKEVLREGETISLYISKRDNQLTALKKEINVGEVAHIYKEGDKDNSYAYRIEKMPTHTDIKRIVGVIDSSFFQSAVEVGVPFAVIDKVVDLFSSDLDFNRSFRKGDTYVLIYAETRLSDGRLKRAGPLKSALLKVNGREYIAVRYVDKKGRERYFDKKGELMETAFLRYPLKFTRISSVFSKARFHPILKRRRPHNGVDFAAPSGTPVRSVADGIVVFAGWKGGGGNTVKIKHSAKYATAYMHLSRISKGIRKGVKVKRGQIIGKVGSTGLATGPHLHFSFYVNGRYVNPLSVKLPKVVESNFEKIPRKLLELAISELRKLESSLRDASRLANL